MAQRRMFNRGITTSDAFLDMPHSSQNLYFHLAMEGDDEGFINSTKKIMRILGAHQDDLNLLFAKKFIIPFESGVVVIKHWRIHNYIRSDRKTSTFYNSEKSSLFLTADGSYTTDPNDGIPLHGNQVTTKRLPSDNQASTKCLPSDNQVTTTSHQHVSIGKDSIGEYSIGECSIEYIALKNSLGDDISNIIHLTQEQLQKLNDKFGVNEVQHEIDALAAYISNKKKDPYKNHYYTLNTWLNKKYPTAKQNSKITAGVDL